VGLISPTGYSIASRGYRLSHTISLPFILSLVLRYKGLGEGQTHEIELWENEEKEDGKGKIGHRNGHRR
jgi:hypothetical protein